MGRTFETTVGTSAVIACVDGGIVRTRCLSVERAIERQRAAQAASENTPPESSSRLTFPELAIIQTPAVSYMYHKHGNRSTRFWLSLNTC